MRLSRGLPSFYPWGIAYDIIAWHRQSSIKDHNICQDHRNHDLISEGFEIDNGEGIGNSLLCLMDSYKWGRNCWGLILWPSNLACLMCQNLAYARR